MGWAPAMSRNCRENITRHPSAQAAAFAALRQGRGSCLTLAIRREPRDEDTRPGSPDHHSTRSAALATSMDGFNKLGWAGVICGVAFMALSFAIKHWAHGANDTTVAVKTEV